MIEKRTRNAMPRSVIANAAFDTAEVGAVWVSV